MMVQEQTKKTMLSEKMVEALNKQINEEFYAAYLYLSMSAYCESIHLKGFADWLRVQRLEELTHALKIHDFLIECNARVTLLPIAEPQTEWATPLAIFEAAYEHEMKVTAMIHNLVKLAEELKEYAPTSLLQWFVDEQIEEESSTREVVKKLKLAGDSGIGLYMVDKELGKRKE
jgi:ferritin